MNLDLDETLTPKQHKAIFALIDTSTLEEAAQEAGISISTLKRWRKEEAFLAEYREARRRVLEDAYARIQGATSSAVNTLVRHLDSGLPTVEVRAAIAILEKAQKGVETYDILERLEALERQG